MMTEEKKHFRSAYKLRDATLTSELSLIFQDMTVTAILSPTRRPQRVTDVTFWI